MHIKRHGAELSSRGEGDSKNGGLDWFEIDLLFNFNEERGRGKNKIKNRTQKQNTKTQAVPTMFAVAKCKAWTVVALCI